MTMGTDLQIIRDDDDSGRAISTVRIHTTANTDRELLAVWLKSHSGGSRHTLRAYQRIGSRFLAALGVSLHHAKLEDVQEALEAMTTKEDGSAVSPATLHQSVAAVKAFLNFAHTVGFTQFNAAPLIKLRAAPGKRAQRIMTAVDVQLFLRAARTPRDTALLEVAYFGALRISEIASLTWAQVIPRDTGEVQLAIVGKGDKPRHVLLPADTCNKLLALRDGAPPSARVFPI